MSDSLSPRPPRRPRYRGKNPRRFEEKYKEHDPQRYAATVEKVLASGKTPAGTHRPIMVAEILEILAPQSARIAVDAHSATAGMRRKSWPGSRPMAGCSASIPIPSNCPGRKRGCAR